MCFVNYGMLLLVTAMYWLKGIYLINVLVAAQIVLAVFNTLTAKTVKQTLWLGLHLLLSTALTYAVMAVVFELCFVEVPFSPKAVGVYQAFIILACGLDLLLMLPSVLWNWLNQICQKK